METGSLGAGALGGGGCVSGCERVVFGFFFGGIVLNDADVLDAGTNKTRWIRRIPSRTSGGPSALAGRLIFIGASAA